MGGYGVRLSTSFNKLMHTLEVWSQGCKQYFSQDGIGRHKKGSAVNVTYRIDYKFS